MVWNVMNEVDLETANTVNLNNRNILIKHLVFDKLNFYSFRNIIFYKSLMYNSLMHTNGQISLILCVLLKLNVNE